MKYGAVSAAVILMTLLSGAPLTAARSGESSGTAMQASADALQPVSCDARPLTLDIARLKSTQGVQNVVVDSTTSVVTLLFTNGDVLRIGTAGCTSALLTARLWVADRTFLSDKSWLEKARFVTNLVLDPDQARQIDESLNDPKIERRPGGVMSIDSAATNRPHYALTVTGRPTDNLGLSMSIVYLK